MSLFSKKKVVVLTVIKGGVKTTKESKEFLEKMEKMEIKNNGK
jgi:hypothetical protein